MKNDVMAMLLRWFVIAIHSGRGMFRIILFYLRNIIIPCEGQQRIARAVDAKFILTQTARLST